jgi:hypothetical protein
MARNCAHAWPARPLFGGRRRFTERRRTAVGYFGRSSNRTEIIMSDYRDPNDPLWRDTYYAADRRGYNAWGWIAGAAFLVIVLAIALGVRNEPTHTAANDTAPTAHTTPAPSGAMKPTGPASPSVMPRPAPAPAPTPPAAPGSQ